MNIQQDFSFLIDSGYYCSDHKTTDDTFFGILELSRIRILIKALSPSGYRIFMADPEQDQKGWKHLSDVSNIISSFGIITDLEDIWLKNQQKMEKKKSVLHTFAINE